MDAIDDLVDWQMGNNPDPGLLVVDMTVTRGRQKFTLGSDGWWRNRLGHIPANSEAWKMLDGISLDVWWTWWIPSLGIGPRYHGMTSTPSGDGCGIQH